MAKSSTSRGKSGGGSNKNTFDKIAKAAMSREMLAAGLTAAAAAIAASPKARKAIRMRDSTPRTAPARQRRR